MSAEPTAPTQPDQAEGERDEQATGKGKGQGVSPAGPAEGGDDAAPRQPGSPRG